MPRSECRRSACHHGRRRHGDQACGGMGGSGTTGARRVPGRWRGARFSILTLGSFCAAMPRGAGDWRLGAGGEEDTETRGRGDAERGGRRISRLTLVRFAKHTVAPSRGCGLVDDGLGAEYLRRPGCRDNTAVCSGDGGFWRTEKEQGDEGGEVDEGWSEGSLCQELVGGDWVEADLLVVRPGLIPHPSLREGWGTRHEACWRGLGGGGPPGGSARFDPPPLAPRGMGHERDWTRRLLARSRCRDG